MSNYDTSGRKKLRAKLAIILRDNLQVLPIEMRNILIDDLICAFEERLKILATFEKNEQPLSRREVYATI